MKIVIFGGTGMVGQGALRACLHDPEVQQVLCVVRSPGLSAHPKLREIVHQDFLDFSPIENELTGLDACLYCLGVTSAGLNEDDYSRVIYGFTIAAANSLLKANPRISFIFVSGQGADSTENGRTMWARVKGKTENDLLKLPFRAAYMFRPGFIQPLHGIRSKTRLYQTFYTILNPILPLLKSAFPKYITTTEQLGRAMLRVAKQGYPSPILETIDIDTLRTR